MFVDQVNISLKAGKGGDGMIAFRREKFVPNGGPAGGDGGRGANIIFQVDTGMSTLMDFKYRKIFKADNGINGGIKRMTGAGASDLIIEVPEGTTIINDDTNQTIADLTNKNSEFVVAKGGRGGRGNTHFASAKNPAPEIAEKGEPGEEINIRLELRLLADVGLVGFPSVGKSTLLKAITNSKPKVAEYHFTTLIPNLGIVKTDYNNDFVIADLPGLIEGASQGVGLGIQFLRHVERTRVILHLIDMSDTEGRNQYEDYQKINEELRNYDKDILKRPQIIVASKMDMPDSEANLEVFKQKLKENDDDLAEKIIPISSVTHSGLRELIQATSDLLENTPKFPIMENEVENEIIYQNDEEKPFEVSRDIDGDWLLTGDKIEKLFKMTDTDHEQSMLRFSRQLKGMGVDQALREAGAKDGDLVTILDFSFTYVD